VSIEYVELVDYLAIVAEVTGLDDKTVARVTKLDLADSALHAPAAGFGDSEFYPDFIEKASVLVVHLAKNHPLPVLRDPSRTTRPALPRAARSRSNVRETLSLSWSWRAPRPPSRASSSRRA
jgi:hypothetical protein